jgi:phosphoribosylglycinamide formyltransferase 1
VSAADLRFAFVTSSAGSVMNEVLKNDFVRSRTRLVVADHDGVAAVKAGQHGVPVVIIDEAEADRFCARLLPVLREHAIDVVFSFYTQFYSEEVRAAFEDRILNFHPSLLPAFKGLDGFGDTIAYGARLAGNTVELIAEVMDEGKIVMQTVCPVDASMPVGHTRHLVFVQQCRALIQVAHWLHEGRIGTDGRRVVVAGARYDSPSYSPSLEHADALGWEPPDPNP